MAVLFGTLAMFVKEGGSVLSVGGLKGFYIRILGGDVYYCLDSFTK